MLLQSNWTIEIETKKKRFISERSKILFRRIISDVVKI